jgi:hypothetical protein
MFTRRLPAASAFTPIPLRPSFAPAPYANPPSQTLSHQHLQSSYKTLVINSFRITFFAGPSSLTPLQSHSSEKHRGTPPLRVPCHAGASAGLPKGTASLLPCFLACLPEARPPCLAEALAIPAAGMACLPEAWEALTFPSLSPPRAASSTKFSYPATASTSRCIRGPVPCSAQTTDRAAPSPATNP